jgi:hypothetical protein
LLVLVAMLTRVDSATVAHRDAGFPHGLGYRSVALVAPPDRDPFTAPQVFPVGLAWRAPAGPRSHPGYRKGGTAGLARAVRTRWARLVVPGSPGTAEPPPVLDLAVQGAGLVDLAPRLERSLADHALSDRHIPRVQGYCRIE